LVTSPDIVYFLALILPFLAVSVRRLHDRDMAGAWIFLYLVPLGYFALLILFALPGTPGPNRFGEDPLARASSE
jgi:uncharacterized membrane protein YhaH (DUF805 family)